MRILPFALLLAISAPAVAQEPLTAEEDLQCGLILAAAGGLAKSEAEKASLASVVGYFLGRYEGKTGKGFEQGGDKETAINALKNVATLGPRCQAAMASMGLRMKAWSQSFQETKPKK